MYINNEGSSLEVKASFKIDNWLASFQPYTFYSGSNALIFCTLSQYNSSSRPNVIELSATTICTAVSAQMVVGIAYGNKLTGVATTSGFGYISVSGFAVG